MEASSLISRMVSRSCTFLSSLVKAPNAQQARNETIHPRPVMPFRYSIFSKYRRLYCLQTVDIAGFFRGYCKYTRTIVIEGNLSEQIFWICRWITFFHSLKALEITGFLRSGVLCEIEHLLTQNVKTARAKRKNRCSELSSPSLLFLNSLSGGDSIHFIWTFVVQRPVWALCVIKDYVVVHRLPKFSH